MSETVTLTVDGRPVTVPAGSTLREAAQAAGVHVPVLCWHPQVRTGSNCRVCVVEVAGNRTLVPSCSRQAEPGMEVRTDSERVRRARRVVLELLLSEADASQAPELLAYAAHYGADPGRFGEITARKRREPIRDNPFFVRDYARCILCRRCTEVCGVGVQHTFAIEIAGRGNRAAIATGGTGLLPDSPCVFCGNCVGACPTGALVPVAEFEARRDGIWPREPALRWSPATGFVAEEV
ncbi:2Fe-2S iron-sulfur cluster-binding protein [Caldinitratiruptor microaerophilus]|uniref:Ferredoxin n=1 Tax=Caldinitratiruptor microaerophilus TaxID=671077 RepID=A0AA35G5E3_9FIRM|nr:2Fe-2S iron-sulfur cluster-binding protein [Caldinitratiruptor microaerophilus]BDG59236.1 hypothetical protein caldi_03260 [Caldinitratiruptor microaerophilus]